MEQINIQVIMLIATLCASLQQARADIYLLTETVGGSEQITIQFTGRAMNNSDVIAYVSDFWLSDNGSFYAAYAMVYSFNTLTSTLSSNFNQITNGCTNIGYCFNQYGDSHSPPINYRLVDLTTGQTTSAVPLPPAAMLFASSLLGLGALHRKKRPAKSE